MIAIGFGSMGMVELLILLLVFLLSAAIQLAILFLIVYAAVRVALRYSPADLIERFTRWFGRAEGRAARLLRRSSA